MMAAGEPVAVAMSGGVDSSVAAALLCAQGFRVVGLTLRLCDPRSAAAPDPVLRARQVAEGLGIPHHVADLRDEFERIILRPFAAEYAAGRTPSPCVVCNARIKFGLLLEQARALGCGCLATGHYAQVVADGDCYRLLRGVDAGKDQSYFLHRLTQAQLQCTRFPLGAWTKDQTRAEARRLGLPAAERPESQDLCFLEGGTYADLVARYHPELRRAGEIVDQQGRVLGRHDGLHRFTVGQRKGLGVATGEPCYVIALQPESGRVVVGPAAAGARAGCLVRDLSWVGGGPPEARNCTVRIRYRHPGVGARIEPAGPAAAWCAFAAPQAAVAPGQAAVFYAGDEVLGGGWIAE